MQRVAVLMLCALLVLAAWTLPSAAQGTYIQIDVPGAIETLAQGVNTAGDICGYYQSADTHFHGFLLSAGVYTTIDYPGSTYALTFGLNDVGQIVGVAVPNQTFGFVYDIGTSSFTLISFPGAIDTEPHAINNVGTIAGAIVKGAGRTAGFQLVGSQYTTIQPPRTTSPVVVGGVSGSGTVVGQATSNGTVYTSFSYRSGRYQVIRIPNAPGASVYG